MDVKSVLTGLSNAANSAAHSVVSNGVNRVLQTAADQFPNQVNRRGQNKGDVASDIVNLVGDVKNDFLSAMGFKRTLDQQETRMLVKIITAAANYKGMVKINNGVTLKTNNYNRIDIITEEIDQHSYAIGEKIKSITFRGPKELEKFYNDCAKQILDSQVATDEDKLIANRFLSGRSTDEKDITSANQFIVARYNEELVQSENAAAKARTELNYLENRSNLSPLQQGLLSNTDETINNVELAATNPQQALINENAILADKRKLLKEMMGGEYKKHQKDPDLNTILVSIDISKKLIETIINQREAAKRVLNIGVQHDLKHKDKQIEMAEYLLLQFWDVLELNELGQVDKEKENELKTRLLEMLTHTFNPDIIDRVVQLVADKSIDDSGVLFSGAKLLSNYLLRCNYKEFEQVKRMVELKEILSILGNKPSGAVVENALLFRMLAGDPNSSTIVESCAKFLARNGDAKYKREALEWLSQRASTQELQDNACNQLNALPPAATAHEVST